jgi:transketolase N-terminal domain/subunit
VVCIVGDAGTEAGVLWESLNFAALNRLPIAYICENNGKSVDARIRERQATPIGPRVAAFGVDVRKSLQAAVASARYNRPAFYEAMVTLECDHLNMSSLLQKWS